MRFVNISSSSQPSLHQCCFSCHRSRSSYQFKVPRLSLVFFQLLFFVNETRSPTPALLFRSPATFLYPISVDIRYLLDPLIPAVLPRPQQESLVLCCTWLYIRCLLIWCIQLPGALPSLSVGYIFCICHL